MSTAIAYLRVSTEDQQLGPEAQRAQIEAWAARQGVTILGWHVDHGVSGATPADRRPALLEALSDVRAQGAAILVAAKRDRLARSVVTAATIEALAAAAGAAVATADGVSCEDTPEGQLMRTLMDAFAEYERSLIAARTRAALAAKRARGEKTGGRVPYGSRLAPDGRTLVPHPEERATLKRIHELRRAGTTIAGIASTLNAERVPARGQRWHATTIARLLRRAA